MSDVINVVFSLSFLNTVLRVSTPLLFVSMGAIVMRQAGILCIALESVILFSALGGVVGSALFQSNIMGILGGILFGMVIILIFGYFVLEMDADSTLTGIALNILGSGGTVFLLYLITGDKGSSMGLNSTQIPNVNIPVIQDIPILGQVLSGHNLLTYLSLLSVLFVYLLIFKTPLGLRIRSAGENSEAAASVGIKVNRTKMTALLIGGALASLGGVYLSMGYLPYFTRDMAAGRGFMAIAAQNLGGGNPLYTMIAAIFFGFAEGSSNVMQSLNLPSELMQMIPYVVTLIGLLFVGREYKRFKHTKMPK